MLQNKVDQSGRVVDAVGMVATAGLLDDMDRAAELSEAFFDE